MFEAFFKGDESAYTTVSISYVYHSLLILLLIPGNYTYATSIIFTNHIKNIEKSKDSWIKVKIWD